MILSFEEKRKCILEGFICLVAMVLMVWLNGYIFSRAYASEYASFAFLVLASLWFVFILSSCIFIASIAGLFNLDLSFSSGPYFIEPNCNSKPHPKTSFGCDWRVFSRSSLGGKKRSRRIPIRLRAFLTSASTRKKIAQSRNKTYFGMSSSITHES